MTTKLKIARNGCRSDSSRARSARPESRASSRPKNGMPPFGQPAGNLAVQRLLRSGAVQAKLTVNKPGDRYEQEADRVAEQVMRMPAQGTPPPIQRACAECEDELHRQPADEEEEMLQAKERPGAKPQVGPGLASRIESLRGRGGPLPTSERAFFEARFGRDFSDVRVHTNADAAEAARAVNARAFTTGRDVVFGPSAFAPGTSAGRKLLAHELTHVVQQSAARGPSNTSAAHGESNALASHGGSNASVSHGGSNASTSHGELNTPASRGPSSRLAKPNRGVLQRTRSYSDCATSDEGAIESAAVQAENDLDTAINALNTRPLTAHVSDALFLAFRSNSVATADAVKQKLQAIRSGLSDVAFECEHPGSLLYDHFCPSGTYGYVRLVAWAIHLCMPHYLTMSANSQARAIVHESSHFFTSASDEGYLSFPDCRETGQTAGDPPAHRLNNADSYACAVHYLAHETAASLATRARSYEGANLSMVQSTAGPIDLSSGVPKDPMFAIGGVPSESGFAYRWVIDVGGDRYRMWSDVGSVFHYGASNKAYIPSGTRALMSSRGITSGEILCRVRLWRPTAFGSAPSTVLVQRPVTFIP